MIEHIPVFFQQHPVLWDWMGHPILYPMAKAGAWMIREAIYQGVHFNQSMPYDWSDTVGKAIIEAGKMIK